MKFSAVIPLYNKEQTIERAVRSVLSQTVQDFEIVVVDDGSTDGGSQIVEGIGDARVRLFRQENQGVSAARNRGIAEARSDLIAFLDADDEWLPGFLQTILRLVCMYPQCHVFATRYLLRHPNGAERRAVLRGFPCRDGILNDYFAVASHSDPPIHSSAVVIAKVAIEAVGGFPERIGVGEDLLTWARLAASFDIVYSASPLVVFHWGRSLQDRPKREPELPDKVGPELRSLVLGDQNRHNGSVEQYVSLWYRMRAHGFIEAGRMNSARKELIHSLWFDMKNSKLWLMLAMTFLPNAVPRTMFRWVERRRIESSPATSTTNSDIS